MCSWRLSTISGLRSLARCLSLAGVFAIYESPPKREQWLERVTLAQLLLDPADQLVEPRRVKA